MEYKVSLKAARVNAELTREQVASAIGIDAKTLWSWERGKTAPSYNKLMELVSLYHVPMKALNLPKNSP